MGRLWIEVYNWMLLENKEKEPRESPSTPKADGPKERALNVLMVETGWGADVVRWWIDKLWVQKLIDRFNCEYWKRDN